MITTTLSKPQEKQLQDCLEIIDKAKFGMVDGVVEIGKALATIKGILPHGQFTDWVSENCRFDQRTSQRYMEAAAAFGKCDKLSYFDDTALYLLAKCEPAATEAKALASKGFRISAAKAKELAEKHKPKPKAKKAEPKKHRIETITDPEPPTNGIPAREPGDDTDTIKAEQAKRKASGKERVSVKDRKAAIKVFSALVKLTDKLHIHAAARPHLEAIHALIEGAQ